MMTVRRMSREGLEKLKQWEGFVPYVYDDLDPSRPRKRVTSSTMDSVRGRLTIGYGHTRTAKLYIGQPDISEKEAERLLLQDLAPCEQAVSTLIKVPLTDGQFDALVSFAYNLGASTAKGSPLANVAETLNTGDYAGAIARMMRYNKARVNGALVTLPGLVNRRAAEAALWAKGSFVAGREVKATEVTHMSAAHGTSVVAAASALSSILTTMSGMSWPVAVAVVVGMTVVATAFVLRDVISKD